MSRFKGSQVRERNKKGKRRHMSDQQDVCPKSRPAGWFSSLACFLIILFVTGAFDSPMLRSRLTMIGLLLLLGQLLINILCGLLLYLRRYHVISCFAKFSIITWFIAVLIYWYFLPDSLIMRLDLVENSVNVTVIALALWHSLVSLFFPSSQNDQTKNGK
jgi:hypothetical protein